MKKNDIAIYVVALLIVGAMVGSYKYFNLSEIPQKEAASNTNTNINANPNNNLNANISNSMDQLKIETIKEGTGEPSKNGDKLTVHYTGTFENGQKFDSSLDRGTPFEFTLGSGMVIQGWEQGMLGMKAGEKRKLFIPYTLGYGEATYGPIPGKSNLLFEVELLKIN